VRAARAANVTVVAVPGPCAAVAALSVAGLPTDRFAFEGFPPPRAAARRALFAALCNEPRTMVFYESSHRVVESLGDMIGAFGAERPAALARELTKRFESVHDGTLARLCAFLVEHENERLGEFVVLVQGAIESETGDAGEDGDRVLKVLLEELPLKEAVKIAVRLTGAHKNALYDRALALKAASSKT
jgi:16S rRNA (cytidine1402-2'-O)-methyltransferase